jgi:peptidoglycan hydrolase-like protein with peptidoglycan-binding domain
LSGDEAAQAAEVEMATTPPIKTRLESPELTSQQPAAVQQRLSLCLASDAHNIRPRTGGDHVKAIQEALEAIRKRMPGIGLEEITDARGTFGPSTEKAVGKYKAHFGIVRPGQPLDTIVGRGTITQMDEHLKSPAPQPAPAAVKFVCGPDVTDQVAATWMKIQSDFRALTRDQKVKACNTILIPVQMPDNPFEGGIPLDLDSLKQKAQMFADINGWDTLPLFQGATAWLRSPPVYDPALKGPCATPSSDTLPGADQANPFDPLHESPDVCSNTVQVAGKCWLNGTVNYGTFGVMVRLCSDFAGSDLRLRFNPVVRAVYSLSWAVMLIRAYKRFGHDPEAAALPVAWTEATFNGGPRATPASAPPNRPKCECSCTCSGNTVPWDYVWEPVHNSRKGAAP